MVLCEVRGPRGWHATCNMSQLKIEHGKVRRGSKCKCHLTLPAVTGVVDLPVLTAHWLQEYGSSSIVGCQ